jgi:AAA+ superfamily predicted ATPase
MQVDALPSYTVVIAATNHSELLDRAVWRRFQLRLQLPAPTQAELTRYFEGFAKKLKESLGHSPAILAEKLGRISYGEAEQFCLDIRRRSVLAHGEKLLKEVVGEQLKLWSARVRGSEQEMNRGGTSPSSTSEDREN